MSSASRENKSFCSVSETPIVQGFADGGQQAGWNQKLAGGNPELQLETLLEISKHSNVSGVSELIVELAGSRIDSLRTAAAQSLESSVQPTLAEVPALMVCLTDRLDGEISYWAATLLGRLGQQAVVATPALCGCLEGSLFLPARERAAWALLKIGPAANEAIPALRLVCESAPARLQKLCQEAINAIGTDSSVVKRRAA
jgi:hypothetical protein